MGRSMLNSYWAFETSAIRTQLSGWAAAPTGKGPEGAVAQDESASAALNAAMSDLLNAGLNRS